MKTTNKDHIYLHGQIHVYIEVIMIKGIMEVIEYNE